jgi:hypothetical protein
MTPGSPKMAVSPPAAAFASMRIQDLRHRLRALGASPDHEARVLRQWVTAQPQDAGKRRIEDFLPLALRNELPAITADLAGLVTLRAAARRVERWPDGRERAVAA